ncbi:MAG: B12-binding domain-containing radical SAM protein [Bacillota bacterium]
MKIILIMPAVGRKEKDAYIKTWQMEPFALAVLAGLTPPDIETAFYDDRLEDINYDEQADLVALNVETYTARRAYQIAARFRERGIPVIMGGYHPTLVPDEACLYSDAILVGEAEGVWQDVLADLKRGKLKKIYRSKQRPSLAGIKPDRKIYRGRKYMPLALVEWGRGCKFSCDFCSITSFYGGTHYYRPVKEVVTEIESLDNKIIFLIDDNIGANPEAAKQLFRELIPLKIRWVSQISINLAEDREMLELMAKSGCQGVLIGFESLNENNLNQMNKAWNNKIRNYDTALARFREYGFVIYGTFVFGYDYDNRESFEITLDFALRNKFFFTAFNHLVPFPGTPLFHSLAEQGRLLDEKWWLNPDYRFGDVVFLPRQMSALELADTCLEYRRKFYNFRSILKRGLDLRTNMKNPYVAATFFAQNLLARQEVNRRQGLPLGNNAMAEYGR